MAEPDSQDLVFAVALDTLRIALRYESTSAFLVYAHENDRSESIASQETAGNLIKWLNQVGCNLRSDRLAKGSDKGGFFHCSVDNGAVHDILENQMCLLPSHLHTDSVEKVILCGSQLLEEYVKTPFYQSYMGKIGHVFDGGQDVRMIKRELRQVVECSATAPAFHHVLTEMALLEILRSPQSQSQESTSIIPVVLNGHLNEVFPPDLFPSTTAKIKLEEADKSGQHEGFFKVLRRLFEGQEFLLKAIETTYRECINCPSQDRNMFKAHALEMFHQAHAKTRRDDSESWTFEKFLQQFRYSSEETAKILQCAQSLINRFVSEEEEKCHQALLPSSRVYSEQKNLNPKRVNGTCLWALKHDNYTQWRDTNQKKLLWISADAGCGKSVLCRAILEEDLPTNAVSACVIYFFFKDGISDQHSAYGCLLALLHQLISQQHSLVQHALPLYRDRGEKIALASFSELWAIFIAMVEDPRAGNVICLLDALDECKREERQQLISSIREFCLAEEQSPSRNLRFLVTSRPYLDVKAEFADITDTSAGIKLDGTLDSESDQIKQEIDLVIRHRVPELKMRIGLPVEVGDYLLKTLLEMAGRTYLWLRLVLDSLPKKWPRTVSQMKKIISELPTGIDAAYESLLAQCDQDYAERVLKIVLAAYRPLTLNEIDIALSVSEGKKSYSDLDLEGPTSLYETLPGRCGLMISVIDSKVYFIHQTVREFLLSKEVQRSAPGKISIPRDGMNSGRIWKGFFSMENAHQLMAQLCMQVLLFTEIAGAFDIYICLLRQLRYSTKAETFFRDRPPFSSYACFSWADHYRDCRFVLGIARSLVHKNSIVTDGAGRQVANAIQLAAAGRYQQIFDLLLEGVSDVNEKTEGDFDTTLVAAVVGGDPAIIKLLLTRGAEVNTQPRRLGNALQVASAGGHLEIVKLLLDWGARVNTQAGHLGNALWAASVGGYLEVVKLLLDREPR